MNASAFAWPVCGVGNRTIEKITGVMMLFRSSAAICGALIALAISVAVARAETRGVHASAVVDAASGDAVVGRASMYNPFKPGKEEGGPSTASGERYDPSVWAAAIKTSLRQKFGGVLFGVRPKFALVEAVGKKVIVKINDVGPLRPGRIIDFNERTMRHFDPSLERGVIDDVKVSPLAGDYWTPGPVS
ncbi:septal ring lytic transglycosylase RlpA family protein [Bradyrhizobium cajani]|nr:septal ring lytic transglycosylase RlpA family protein [Bradyrhizobium cajani]MCP3367518.1 septal ring lytic transglycosylase RlpA family protein [Bradyrhizobium cajani]